jgi:hypothetical protein
LLADNSQLVASKNQMLMPSEEDQHIERDRDGVSLERARMVADD